MLKISQSATDIIIQFPCNRLEILYATIQSENALCLNLDFHTLKLLSLIVARTMQNPVLRKYLIMYKPLLFLL